MKQKSRISLGPGAPSLILIFVVLSMSVLGMLALMSARNDLHLSERSAEVAEIVYALTERAEERHRAIDNLLAEAELSAEPDEAALAALAERLPEGVRLDGREISWVETQDERRLECALLLQTEDGSPRTVWSRHKLVTELSSGEMEDLWN